MTEQVTDERIAEIRAMFERSEFWDMPAENVIGDLLLALDAATASQQAMKDAGIVRDSGGTLRWVFNPGKQEVSSWSGDEYKCWHGLFQQVRYLVDEIVRRREAAEAELARLRAQGTWQPIETAPEAQRVWVWVPNLGSIIALKTTHPSDGAVWWDGEQCVYNPTHWQPLPAQPDAASRPEQTE